MQLRFLSTRIVLSAEARLGLMAGAILLLAGCAAPMPSATQASGPDTPPPALTEITVDPTPAPTPTPEPSPTATPPPSVENPSEELIAQGIQVYRSAYCGVCHTLTPANTRGSFAPNHDHVAAAARQHLADPGYNGSATTVADYMMESLLTPQRYLVPGYELSPHAMPAFSHLSETDLNALVAMLSAQE